MSSADTISTAIARSNIQVARVLNRIRRLGLEVSVEKTEAIVFYGKNRPPRTVRLQVDREDIEAKPTLKYLGIMLDGRFNFRPHFEYVEDKIGKVNRALGRLMPNLRGPNENKRRLYAQVVLSIFLYGAPVWNEAFVASRSSQITINRVLPNTRRRVYDRTKDLRNSNRWSKKAELEIKTDEDLLLRRQWEVYCENPNLAGARTREAILPHFQEWISRKHGSSSFRTTQLLTGHGCFGTYLYRIGKASMPYCEHCNVQNVEDSPEHTLRDCTAWEENRNKLCESLEVNVDTLSLEKIIQQVLCSKEKWEAFAEFANVVMLRKEVAERARQEEEARRVNNTLLDGSGSDDS
ncbi:uncharacterized protein LOC126850972 [Cataglyphis hispanica]|uniref:uncharacterized protein LOC126850972 n=1 Tax=Cataglyphis hispanica TaxID=1086592 RepID=UPI00217F576B|nr:uncharacterized protein LOC126850972 [Cataglyphis hispanica]